LDDTSGYVTVFAGSPTDATFVRGLLEANGVETFLEDETLGAIAPYILSAGSEAAARVLVATVNVERAKEILAKR
jgi:hypothetical protein